MIEVARRNSTVEIIAQKIHPVDRDKKHPLLAHLIKTNNWSQVLVFTRTKHGANKLVEQLEKDGIPVVGIMHVDDLEDYLELHDSDLNNHIAKSNAEYRDGKARDVKEFLAELKTSSRKTKK